MQVFEQARALVKAFRESEEGRKIRRIGAKVKAGEKLESLLGEFRTAQLEIQAAQLQGKVPGKEEGERYQRLAQKVEASPLLVEYLTVEAAYGKILMEVQQVLAEAFSPDVPGGVKPARKEG
jgi:cell fate (sporulation/competence/biofilm development) regulator YlbF (YheA/YmcA/DUF963 family)